MSARLGRALSRQLQPAAHPQGGCTWQRATVVTWDPVNGYVILLDGANLTDVPVLASAGTPSPGDQVAVIRQQTSVLIIGVITDSS